MQLCMRRRRKRKPVTRPRQSLGPVPMQYGPFAPIYLQTIFGTMRIPDAEINLNTQIG
jgi:hypothetical protein